MKKVLIFCIFVLSVFGEEVDLCRVEISNISTFACVGGYLFWETSSGNGSQVLNSKGLPATCECIKNENTKKHYDIRIDRGVIKWRD